MTQRTTSAHTLLRRFWLRRECMRFARSLLQKSLSCIGVLSLLSSNPVLAKTSAKAATNPAPDYNNAHIDPTDYSIGATSSYSAPRRRTLVAVRRTQFINTVRLPSRQARRWARRSRPTGQLGKANTKLLFPLTVPATITSLFGWRIHPITGNRRLHTGTDLGAPLGTPVLAAYAGNVAIADFWGGYGLTVVLEHNKSTQQTLYGHLSEIFVQPGEWVEQGTVIGRVGSTGHSTGPHLHFETRQLTPSGWFATDPGAQLEYALAQLVQALQKAQAPQ